MVICIDARFKGFLATRKAVLVFFCGLLFVILAISFRARAASATCYWVGDTSPANWNDATHWSSSSAGTGSTCDGGVVPGSDDTVIFSGNNNNVTMDASPTIAALTNSGDYSGTLNMNGNSLTVSGDFAFKSGALTAGAGALTVSGNLDINGASYTYNTQNVTLGGSSKTIDIGSNYLYQLTVDGSISIANSDANIYYALTVNSAKTLSIPNGRKVILANTASSTFSGTVEGDGTLELIKYACKNLGTGGIINVNVRCKPQSNPTDNVIPARTFGKDFEILNDTGSYQRIYINTGSFIVYGDLNINESNAAIWLTVSSAVTDFTVLGDLSFVGSQIGGHFVLNSAVTYTFAGNVDMNNAEWLPGATCQTKSSVVFSGNDKYFNYGTYHDGTGCFQNFYDMRISGSNFNLYDVDAYDNPSLGSSYSKQGLRVMNTLTIDDGASLVINNTVSNPSCYKSGFRQEWYSDSCVNGMLSMEVPSPRPSGWDGPHLDIQGTGTITGDGYLRITGWGQYPANDFDEADGTLDVNVMMGTTGTTSYDLKIVGRTFNKDLAFVASGNSTDTFVLGNAADQTLTILGDFISDADSTSDYQFIDADTYGPNVNISGDYWNDIYRSTSYLKMGSGEWKVGGNFEVTSTANRVYGENATLTMYGDEKKLAVSQFSGATPYFSNAQGIGTINIDDSTNPSNTIYLDKRLAITQTLNIDSTSNLSLRNYSWLEMWSGSTTNVNGEINGDIECLEMYDSAIDNFNFSDGHINLPLRIVTQTQNVTIPAKNYYMDVEISNRSGTAYKATLGTAAGQTLTFKELYLDGEAPAGSNITVDGATHNPTINVTGNVGVRGSLLVTKTFDMGNGDWNVGGNVNFSSAVVNSGNSTLKLTGGSSGEWQDITQSRSTFYALAEYDGEMYASGNFTSIEGVSANYIAKWDGAQWSAVSTGCNNIIYTLFVYDNKLYAGGDFTTCGGTPANYVASWDGGAWAALGAGLNDTPKSMTSYDGLLVVGGWFTDVNGGGTPMNSIGAWDGASWSAIGGGIANDSGSDTVRALKEYNGRLYAGGGFFSDDSIDNDYFAYYDGSAWSYPGGVDEEIYAIDTYNNNIIVGGYFQTVEGSACKSTAVFSGSEFTCMGSGIDSTSPTVYDFVTYNNKLYAGGHFGGEDNYQPPNYNILQWGGSDWISTGTESINRVYDFEYFGDDLIATGTSVASVAYAGGHVSRLAVNNNYLTAGQGGYPATQNVLYDLEVASPSNELVILSDDITLNSTFINNTAGSNVLFESNEYFAFPDLDVNGANGGLISLGSTDTGTAYYLVQDQPDPSLTYVDTSDSDASLGNTVTATRSVDSGNNTNWAFSDPYIEETNPADDPVATATPTSTATVVAYVDNSYNSSNYPTASSSTASAKLNSQSFFGLPETGMSIVVTLILTTIMSFFLLRLTKIIKFCRKSVGRARRWCARFSVLRKMKHNFRFCRQRR